MAKDLFNSKYWGSKRTMFWKQARFIDILAGTVFSVLEMMGTHQLEGEVMCNYPLARTGTTLTRTITRSGVLQTTTCLCPCFDEYKY